jgi:hypothetical protein
MGGGEGGLGLGGSTTGERLQFLLGKGLGEADPFVCVFVIGRLDLHVFWTTFESVTRSTVGNVGVEGRCGACGGLLDDLDVDIGLHREGDCSRAPGLEHRGRYWRHPHPQSTERRVRLAGEVREEVGIRVQEGGEETGLQFRLPKVGVRSSGRFGEVVSLTSRPRRLPPWQYALSQLPPLRLLPVHRWGLIAVIRRP